jgi:hypothetical protein
MKVLIWLWIVLIVVMVGYDVYMVTDSVRRSVIGGYWEQQYPNARALDANYRQCTAEGRTNCRYGEWN